jgi:hypothetical protein
MSLDIRALISAHAGEASALNEVPVVPVYPRLPERKPIGFDRAGLRGSGLDPHPWGEDQRCVDMCGLVAQELKRPGGLEGLSQGFGPQWKATA